MSCRLREEDVARRFAESVERGLAALQAGGPFSEDMAPVDGAPVETLDYYDAFTGEHVMIWRVKCRALSEAELAVREGVRRKPNA